MRYFLAYLLLTAACTRSALEIGGTACGDLDEKKCRETAGCAVAQCPDCSGGGVFGGCYDAASVPACPAILCACHGLNQTSCEGRQDCRADHCPGCRPGLSSFSDCRARSEAPLPCGAPAQCPECETAKDTGACDALPGCHPVFRAADVCDCIEHGCCQVFKSCAQGEKARCTGPARCDVPAPVCGGDYVVGYTPGCYEGCVHRRDCQ